MQITTDCRENFHRLQVLKLSCKIVPTQEMYRNDWRLVKKQLKVFNKILACTEKPITLNYIYQKKYIYHVFTFIIRVSFLIIELKEIQSQYTLRTKNRRTVACDCTIVTIHYLIWYNHSAIVRLRFVREVYIYKPSSVENIYFELKKLTQKAVQSVMRFLIWNVETKSNQL